MERSMARLRRWIRASTTSLGSLPSASLMSRSKYGSYRSSYLSPFGSDHRITHTQHNLHSDQENEKKRTRSRRAHGGIEARSDPGVTVFPEARGDGVHVEAGERVAARVHQPVRQHGHHRRHGGGDREVSFVLRGGGMRFPLRLLAFVGEEERLWAWVWTRSRAEAYGRSR